MTESTQSQDMHEAEVVYVGEDGVAKAGSPVPAASTSAVVGSRVSAAHPPNAPGEGKVVITTLKRVAPDVSAQALQTACSIPQVQHVADAVGVSPYLPPSSRPSTGGMGAHLPALKKRALSTQSSFTGRPTPGSPAVAASVAGPSTAYWNVPAPGGGNRYLPLPAVGSKTFLPPPTPVPGPAGARQPPPHLAMPAPPPAGPLQDLPVYDRAASQEDLEKSE